MTVGEETTKNIKSNTNCESITLLKKNELNCLHSCFLYYVDQDEVLEVVRKLKAKSSSDIYGMNTDLLKRVIIEIVEPMTAIINACFGEGIFPSELKLAKVVPIHKKDDKNKVSNYRPISILPAISKIFEYIIKDRIMSFINKHDMLSDAQHGYRPTRSTITAMIEMIEEVLETRDEKKVSMMVMCDLSKAFDCVSHEILLEKLWYYGIRGNTHDIIKSYLQNRNQAIWWQNNLSHTMEVTTGVPQGSILGPLLFIVYINDMPVNIKNCSVFIYADDTTILLKGDPDELQAKKDEVLLSAEDWFDSNKLKLNTDKTQSLTIGMNQVHLDEKVTFLGLTVDNKLTWSNHVQGLCGKLCRAIYSIRTLKSISTHQAAKLAYYANFHSLASYGIIVWGMSSEADRVQILQKRALRTLCSLSSRVSCREYFKREKILTITSVYILSCVKFVHANLSRFIKNEDLHSYKTRNRNAMVIPLHRLKSTQQGIDYWGVKLYNQLPESVKSLSINKFAKAVKKLLIEKTYYSVNEFLTTNLHLL